MSEFTIRVDQFLINILQPNIDSLNMSLVAMEENGFGSKAILDTRRKLNRLMLYDNFLKEYAKGNEEFDVEMLNDILRIVGEVGISSKSNAKIIQAARDTLDINIINSCENFTRIYLNDEILTTKILPPLHDPAIFKIYGPKNATSISVVVTYTGLPAQPAVNGINYVTIEDIDLFDIEGISFEITTVVCNITYVSTISYTVQDVSCDSTTFWVGSTIERFSIADSLEESSDIAIDPNSGTTVDPVELNYTWITSATEINNLVWRNTDQFSVTTNIGDCHIIVMVPVALEIVDVNEDVGGTLEDMTKGVHYEMMIDELVSPGAKFYNCYYFRDLTSTTYTEERTIVFTVQQK